VQRTASGRKDCGQQCSASTEKFAGEIKVALVGNFVTKMAEMAMCQAEAIFQNELKRCPGGFGDVQEK